MSRAGNGAAIERVAGAIMVRTAKCLAALVVAMTLAGCTKEDVRLFKFYTFQLDDEPKKAPKKHVAAVPANDTSDEKKAATAAAATPGTSSIETGSTQPDACQGEHIAYQATKEYLKNFGPKPPDEPGEKGPCRSASEPAAPQPPAH